MGKYTKSNKNNIFRDKPEIAVSEHTVEKDGKKMKEKHNSMNNEMKNQ